MVLLIPYELPMLQKESLAMVNHKDSLNAV